MAEEREPWVTAWVDQIMTEVTHDAHRDAVEMLAGEGLTIEAESAADDLIGVGVGYGAAKVIEVLLRKDLIKVVDKPV